MQIYLGSYCLYSFDRKKAFKAKYMAKNPLESREYEMYDENNIEHGSNAMTKS